MKMSAVLSPPRGKLPRQASELCAGAVCIGKRPSACTSKPTGLLLRRAKTYIVFHGSGARLAQPPLTSHAAASHDAVEPRHRSSHFVQDAGKHNPGNAGPGTAVEANCDFMRRSRERAGLNSNVNGRT